MPKRYRSRSRSRPRKFRRRGVTKRYRRVRRFRRGRRRFPATGFPGARKTVKLIYHDYDTPVLQIGTSQNVNWNTYNLNSAYDPNASFASSSIPGFNEWAGVYFRYRVTWCKITATFTQAVDNPALYCGIYFRPVTGESGFSTWRDWIEIAGNPMPNRRIVLGNAQGSASTRTISVKSSLGRLIGQRLMLNADVSYSANTNANPSNILQGFVFIATMDGSIPSTPLNIYMNVRVTYYVTFWNRRTLKG